MYSMMNHAAIVGGTWWPSGGMSEIPKAMVSLAEELGVKFKTNAPVKRILVDVDGNPKVSGVELETEVVAADVVVAAADYHHVEQQLLEPRWRTHTERYWDRRVMSPGSVLWYLGLSRKINNLR
jgi:phytoene desaturase